MTDEKLKELAKLECAKLLKSEKGYNGLSYQEFWAEGVKYGLSEGEPKWHDLRKNSEDLPKETGHYLTDDGDIYVYDAFHKKWRTIMCKVCDNFDWLDDGDIIAWCEIPNFER